MEPFITKIHETIHTYGRKTAFTYMRESRIDEKISFEKMGDYLLERSKIYSEMGLKKADRVAIIAPHSPYTVMTGMSLAYCGIVMVLIDASLPLEEIEKLINFAEVRAIFTTEEIYRNLSKTVKMEYPCWEVSSDTKCKCLQEKVCELKTTDYKTEDDVIAILFSSGTTGQMKGIMVTYESVLKARGVFARLAGLEDYMTYLLVLPFNHIAGFTGAMTYFLTGCEIGFIENVNASKLQEGLLKFQPYYFAMVPKVYEVMEQKIRASIKEKGKAVEVSINSMLSLSGFLRRHFGINIGRKLFKGITKQVFGEHIYGIGTGASPCKDETTEFFLNLGLEWANLYATTETSVPIVATGIHDRYPVGTVGNVNHHPEIHVKIGKKDEQGFGEILVKSELMMKGYFKQPEMTKEVFDKEGYFKTGDYGFIDKKGYLHITGRIKESIILQSGKKVSPVDVDSYYSNRLNGIEVASRGITKTDGQYDEIHLFLSQSDLKEQRDVVDRIWEISRNAPQMYKIEGVHVLESIPKTSVGKVKRYMLEIPKVDYHALVQETKIVFGEDTKDVVLDLILQKLSNISKEQLSMESTLKDIGLDSLNIFQLCIEIQEKLGKSIETQLYEDITIGEIVSILENSDVENVYSEMSVYPLPRTKKDERNFKWFKKLSRRFWTVRVRGLEQLDLSQQYIFCPNHESHIDGMLVLSCLPEEQWNKICSIAADYLFDNKVHRPGIRIMGGIPVHRTGNTTPAMKRAYECIVKDGCNLLIHPEGTRTRDGKMGEFKPGAAQLSIQTGRKIVPIYIKGTREVFPPNRKLPRIFHFRKKKYEIDICFGRPIAPEDVSKQVLTEKIREQIVEMKGENLGEDNIKILSVIKRYSKNNKVTMDSMLKEDIGLDSLATYEMVGELEELFHVEIANKISDVKSVGELYQIVQENKRGSKNKQSVYEQNYPLARTRRLNRKLERWIRVSRKLYDFEISGRENLEENSILCANHASYFDPVWILAAVGEEHFHMDKIACLAAVHTLNESPGFFNMLGGIPVERSGNTLPALKSAKKCLENGYTMIIFPEGARSRDGSMLPFKNGAAKLAIETGKPIIPISIEGAFEIFPRNHRLPSLYDWKKRNKYKLKIQFGKPIIPIGYGVEELTGQIRQAIERMH